MKIIFGSRRLHHLARVNIFLIMLALIAGMVGCDLPPTQIRDWYDLHAVRDNLGGNYLLMNDLDSTTAGYIELVSERANLGKGWWPIGTSDDRFTGSFNGQGYEIRDLFINRPDENYVGLFGLVDEGGVIENVDLVNANVAGKQHVGGLVGINSGTLTNSYSSGSMTGDQYVGGLVGINEGTVTNSYYNYDEVLINGENIITIGALFAEDFEQWLANDKFLDVNQRLSKENGYYVINNVSDFKELLAFGQDGSLKFRLTNDLYLGNEANFYIPYLAGEFDGDGHKILNLSFDFDSVSQVGLFGYLASGGKVTQVGLENVNITGSYRAGSLVGGNDGMVSNSYSSGNVTGDDCVGGLVGCNWKGTVSNSYSTSSVAGSFSVGGLVGINEGIVTNSYSSGSVTGWYSVGGLVGINEGTVTNSYSGGSVTGWYSSGGLIGTNSETVSHSYSTGSVTGNYYVGGLVGINGWDSTVSHSYSTGNMTGNYYVGGLVGVNFGTVINSYSSGNVAGDEYVGGLVGVNWEGTVSNSFWDTKTSGQANSAGGTGKTTAEMQDIATFLEAVWDICTVAPGATNPAYTWNIVHEQTYPFLSWQSVV